MDPVRTVFLMPAPRSRPGRARLLAPWLAVSLVGHAGLLAVLHGGSQPWPDPVPVQITLSSRWVSGVPAPGLAPQHLASSLAEASSAQPSAVPVPVPTLPSPPSRAAGRGQAMPPPSAAPSPPVPMPVTPPLTTAPAQAAAEPAPLFPALPAAPDYLSAAHLDERPALQGEVQLHYPEEADRQEGVVVLRLLINERGEVDNVGVVRAFPPGLFEQEAITAFARASFLPGKRAGIPVKSQTVIAVDFTPFNRGAVSGQGY